MIILADIQKFWTIPPQWGSQVAVSHRWMTGIQRGVLGNEKRSSYFSTYRLKEKFEVSEFSDAEASWIKGNMFSYSHSLWGVPIWPDVAYLTADSLIGATTINCDTTYRHFKADGFALLLDMDDFTVYEALQIDTVAASYFTITQAVTADWLTGAVVFPMFPARLTDPSERKVSAVFGSLDIEATELRLEGSG